MYKCSTTITNKMTYNELLSFLYILKLENEDKIFLETAVNYDH
jgi:hypothetical protein